MKTILLPALFFLITLQLFAQDTTITTYAHPADTLAKSNAILFASIGGGVSFGGINGIGVNGEMVYGFKNNLIAARAGLTTNITYAEYALIFPVLFKEKFEDLYEISGLYGRQFAWGGHAINILAGLSYNSLTTTLKNDGNRYVEISRYWGMPFEASIIFFKPNKKRLRFLWIPIVKKPTSVGYSIGFKFYGNVAKRGYAALGVVYGFGMHKHYTD